MRLLFLPVAIAVTACALGAQQPAPMTQSPQQAQAEVLAVVNRLWEAMRTNDSAMARSVFEPGTQMIRIVDRNGTRTVRRDSIGGFVRAIGSATEPWIERMVAPEVRVDQNLASVWTWYDFTTAGRVSHCGYDSMELARLTDGWKIIYLADTRTSVDPQRPDLCKPPVPR